MYRGQEILYGNSAATEKGGGSNSLLFGGFKLHSNLPNNTGGQDIVATGFINPLSGSVDATPETLTIIPNNETGNAFTRFTFSEVKKSYTAEYSQSYYKNLSINSLDSLYLPVSISGGVGISGGSSGNLSRYVVNTGSVISGMRSRPFSSMPPVTLNIGDDTPTVFDLHINTMKLNPYTSSGIMSLPDVWDTGLCNNSTKGFVVQNVTMSTGIQDFIWGNATYSGTTIDIDRQAETDFRFNAMRGPLVLQAWGYDTNGKPIPNANDSPIDTESGIFRDNGLKDKFLENWLTNPKTWPVAPVDLRFDRNRGVWVAPTQNKILLARMKENLSPLNKATAELINLKSANSETPSADSNIPYYSGCNLWGPNGEDISQDVRNATVTVYDYLNTTVSKGSLVYLYYDDGKYIVINQKGGGGNAIVPARTLGSAGTGGTFTAQVVDSSNNFLVQDDTANNVTVTDYLNIIPYSIPLGTPITIADIGEANSCVVSIGLTPSDIGFNSSVGGLNFDAIPIASEVPTYFIGMNGSNIVKYAGIATCDQIIS